MDCKQDEAENEAARIRNLASVEDRKNFLTKAVRTSAPSIQPQVALPEIKGKVSIPDAFVKESSPDIGDSRSPSVERAGFPWKDSTGSLNSDTRDTPPSPSQLTDNRSQTTTTSPGKGEQDTSSGFGSGGMIFSNGTAGGPAPLGLSQNEQKQVNGEHPTAKSEDSDVGTTNF